MDNSVLACSLLHLVVVQVGQLQLLQQLLLDGVAGHLPPHQIIISPGKMLQVRYGKIINPIFLKKTCKTDLNFDLEFEYVKSIH